MRPLGEHMLLLLAIQWQPLEPLPTLYNRKSICCWLGSGRSQWRISACLTPAKQENRAEISEAGETSGPFFFKPRSRLESMITLLLG